MIVLGAYLPCAVFVVLLTLFTFAYAHVPWAVWLTTAVAADALLVGAWPPKGGTGGFRVRQRSDFLPFFAALFAVGAAVCCGTFNASVMEPWIHVKHLKEHSDVLPSDSPVAFADAGVLNFAPGSHLDSDGAAGFLSWPYTYCAAPIRPPDGASGGGGGEADSGSGGNAAQAASPPMPGNASAALGFFAVGVNCCDSRGGFTCGDASDPQALSGLRVEGASAGAVDAKGVSLFLRAAQMAAAAGGEVAAPAPVLVVWNKNPQAYASSTWWIAFAIYFAMLLFSLCFMAGSRRLLLKANAGYSGPAFTLPPRSAAALAAARGMGRMKGPY